MLMAGGSTDPPAQPTAGIDTATRKTYATRAREAVFKGAAAGSYVSTDKAKSGNK